MRTYLCFDFGGTFIKYAVISQEEQILVQDKFPTICDDYDRFMEQIRSVYEQNADVSGIGISMPGILAVEHGHAFTAGEITCLAGRNIAEEISRLCGGLTVVIENDAKAAAYAELAAGSLKDCRNGAVIVIGTALGGTVVVDRKILRGQNLFAGEFSFLYYCNEHVQETAFGDCPGKYDRDGRGIFPDRCTPKRICQLYSSMTGEPLDVKECPRVFEAARSGSLTAMKAIRTVCSDLAMLIFNLQCIIDPDVIAIGGGISNDDLFLDILKEEVERYADHPVPGAPVPVIKRCRYGSDANLWGVYFQIYTQNLKE